MTLGALALRVCSSVVRKKCSAVRLGFLAPRNLLPRNRLALEAGKTSAFWDWGERGTIPETTAKMQEMEEGGGVLLPECDWLDALSEDPYYRGLQDKVPATS